MLNITDCGAVGDGSTINTRMIQAAIEKCADHGGGVVFVPPGVFITGTIYLRDNICLELSPGAILRGSPHRQDYNADDFCAQNRSFSQERVSGAHLVVAVEKHHVAIRGGGRIEGNAQVWMNRPSAADPKLFEIPEWRPGQMLFFCECTDVTIDNIELFHAAYWTCFLHGCEHVRVHSLRIFNDRLTPEGDGLDIDCCRYVTVSDCDIDVADDCITLRGHLAPLRDQSRVCEYVTITNCILRTSSNAFRIGVGNGTVRNCLISNIVIRDTHCGICLVSRYSKTSPGVLIENIHFENIMMETRRPINIAADVHGPQDEPAKPIRNISFHHLRGRGCFSSYIQGNTDGNVSGITLVDVVFEYNGGEHIIPDAETYRAYGVQSAPAAFYIAHAREIEFHRVRVNWQNINGPWKYALQAKQTAKVTLSQCNLNAPPHGQSTQIS